PRRGDRHRHVRRPTARRPARLHAVPRPLLRPHPTGARPHRPVGLEHGGPPQRVVGRARRRRAPRPRGARRHGPRLRARAPPTPRPGPPPARRGLGPLAALRTTTAVPARVAHAAEQLGRRAAVDPLVGALARAVTGASRHAVRPPASDATVRHAHRRRGSVGERRDRRAAGPAGPHPRWTPSWASPAACRTAPPRRTRTPTGRRSTSPTP